MGYPDSNFLAEIIVTNRSCAIKNAKPQILGSKKSQKWVLGAQTSRVASAANIQGAAWCLGGFHDHENEAFGEK